MNNTLTAQQVIDAIDTGIRSGAANDDWDAPQMESARRLTKEAGCVWDFDGWRETRECLTDYGKKLGGVQLA